MEAFTTPQAPRQRIRDTEAYQMMVDESFMDNMSSVNPAGYQRDTDEIPSEIVHEWTKASVKKRGQAEATQIKGHFNKVAAADAEHYGVAPETLFELLAEALDEQYANADFGEFEEE